MYILADRLSPDARSIVDCLEIIRKAGHNRKACINQTECELAEVDKILSGAGDIQDESSVVPLLQYKKRLQNAREYFIHFFE